MIESLLPLLIGFILFGVVGILLLPIPASITLALLIFALTMVYEKVRYHEIFYPYDGD